MSSNADLIEVIRRRYCPPLDDALFYALATDFDLSNNQQRCELENTLDSLKENAAVEQDLELLDLSEDLPVDDGPQNVPSETVSSGKKITGTTSQENSTTSATGTSQLKLYAESGDDGDSGDLLTLDLGEEGQDLEDAPAEMKIKWLRHMFPSVTQSRIHETLTRCQGDIHRTTDELLNLAFIIGEDLDDRSGPVKPILKGVDGFAVNEDERLVPKGKHKNKKQRKDMYQHDSSNPNSVPSTGIATPVTNVWQAASQDIEFIVSRTALPMTVVKSAYHDSGASLSKTIQSFVDTEATALNHSGAERDQLQLQMEELRFIFENLPDSQLYGALILAKNIPSAAEELLEAMIHPPVLVSRNQNLAIIPQYTPLNLSEDEDKPTQKHPSTRQPVNQLDRAMLLDRANHHGAAANQAVGQATAAFKRGKSNHLYGGAAAYYASEFHDQKKREKALLSSAADALVAQQSGSNYLDLHGVNVKHAKRIAREKVEGWWKGLGDRKLTEAGRAEVFSIITGIGTHSSQGIAKIGPAVSTMLINEGWKINVQRGEIFVEGKKRK